RVTRRASSDAACFELPLGIVSLSGRPCGQEGESDARVAEPVPCAVGLQVPHRDHTQVPPQSLLRQAAAADRRDLAGSVPSTRSRIGGRSCDARPHPPLFEYTAQVERGLYDRLSEREKCGTDPSRIAARATDDRTALLGGGVLCEYSRVGRS